MHSPAAKATQYSVGVGGRRTEIGRTGSATDIDQRVSSHIGESWQEFAVQIPPLAFHSCPLTKLKVRVLEPPPFIGLPSIHQPLKHGPLCESTWFPSKPIPR